ncbi:MAG: hemerythrin domain-containing protein [Bradyrhizobiaceae bacterium]|nr:hemerythrin domain-containing protein [Bradyrhizobiaceae bacterium]
MNFSNRISQILHDEHGATVALMERLEQLVTRHKPANPPDTGDRAVVQLLSDLAASMEAEVERHFAFEEEHIFTYLSTMGDDAISAHLTEEHAAIRPLGTRIATLCREAAAQGFDDARWQEFRRVGLELTERMLAHVQKEEMALLPVLEENLDPETEALLLQQYTEEA